MGRSITCFVKKSLLVYDILQATVYTPDSIDNKRKIERFCKILV